MQVDPPVFGQGKRVPARFDQWALRSDAGKRAGHARRRQRILRARIDDEDLVLRRARLSAKMQVTRAVASPAPHADATLKKPSPATNCSSSMNGIRPHLRTTLSRRVVCASLTCVGALLHAVDAAARQAVGSTASISLASSQL